MISSNTWKKSFFFFFCVPGHARSSGPCLVSQIVGRWGRIAGCGWGFEDLCRMDIRLSGKFSVYGGGRGVDRVQFSVWRLWKKSIFGKCCNISIPLKHALKMFCTVKQIHNKVINGLLGLQTSEARTGNVTEMYANCLADTGANVMCTDFSLKLFRQFMRGPLHKPRWHEVFLAICKAVAKQMF